MAHPPPIQPAALAAPPPEVIQQIEFWAPGLLAAFLSRLGPVARHVTQFTSWWRSIDRNARVGGSPESQHLWAAAVDATGPNLRNIAIAARSSGLIAVEIPAKGIVHIQAWPAGSARRIGLLDVLHL